MGRQTRSSDGIIEAMRTVANPELGINVLDLGLVYGTEVSGRDVPGVMTMTTPACPPRSYLREAAVEATRERVSDAGHVAVESVWEPKWNAGMMSQRARRQLRWQQRRSTQ